MPYTRHELSEVNILGGGPTVPGAITEARCACGTLVMRGTVGVVTPADIYAAIDRHIIHVLDTTYVRQFQL